MIDSECILFFKMAFSNISAHSLVYLYDCATSSRGGGNRGTVETVCDGATSVGLSLLLFCRDRREVDPKPFLLSGRARRHTNYLIFFSTIFYFFFYSDRGGGDALLNRFIFFFSSPISIVFKKHSLSIGLNCSLIARFYFI